MSYSRVSRDSAFQKSSLNKGFSQYFDLKYTFSRGLAKTPSLHMLADLSVPHHMRNEATKSHVQWENKADVFLQTYNPQYYIYVSVPRNSQNPIKDILSSSDLAKEWQKNLERCFSTSPGDMDYCMLEPTAVSDQTHHKNKSSNRVWERS